VIKVDASKVCVVGSGFLGTQIGVLSARYGYNVSMQDISIEALDTSKKAVGNYVQQWLDNGKITGPEGDALKQRIFYATELKEAVNDAGLVIEAVVERLDVKQEVFKILDELCPPSVVLATNSSSIKISYIEKAIQHRERVLNMHFYSFPWKRRVLELMRGTQTTDKVMESAIKYSYSIGVKPLIVLKESTGFIFNRVWRAIKKECLTVVDEGVASFEDVDRAWMSLYDTDLGPFGLMDRVGLDVVRDIELVYYRESGDPKDKPPKILLDKINQGEIGVKTGKGFYSYPNPAFREPGWIL
jgi:3-hydroxybutyryl-CoA dehydrogenase